MLAYTSKQYPNFLDAFDAVNPPTGVALFQLGGRLVPRPVVSWSTDSLVSALRNLNTKGAIVSGMSLNPGGKPHPDNAVNPAWRHAGLSIVMGT